MPNEYFGNIICKAIQLCLCYVQTVCKVVYIFHFLSQAMTSECFVKTVPILNLRYWLIKYVNMLKENDLVRLTANNK